MAARAGILYETPRTPQRRPLEPVARAIITHDGERMMGAELARLRHELEVDFPERLREARDFGEIDENDDYLQVKEEEAVVALRIQRLRLLLDSASVVEGHDCAADAVTIGSLVEVEDVTSGEVRAHRLTGDYQPHGPDDISASSPIGRALFGRATGQEVSVALPDGRERTLKITGIGSSNGPPEPKG
jgi:transcription elongation factor GreA